MPGAERNAVRTSLTWKLVLGFLFAVVLQVSQMTINGHFTGRMQAASELVAGAMAASLAVQGGVDAVRQLRERLAADREAEVPVADCAVYQVYLDAVGDQATVLDRSLAGAAGGRFAAIPIRLAAAQQELRALRKASPDGAAAQAVRDAADFFDDSVAELEQELLKAQIEVRELAVAGVELERSVHDLPVRASLAITFGGVVLMALFVAWFSRQLVVPIQKAWEELERRVAERTAELAATVGELEQEIAERQRTERQKEELHRQLVESSRRAGMAELANGVLHNVGNVLNSVNVSVNLLLDRLRKSKVDGLDRAVALLRAHEHELPDWLAASPQGRKLPAYLTQLATHLTQERDALVDETQDLTQRVDVMKEIVGRQQSYARVSGATQRSRLSVIVEDALHMHAQSFADLDIRVETDFAWDEEGDFDRSRVLQILMNLVSNAKHALRDRAQGGGILRVETALVTEGRVRIAVTDNGVGIAPENLAKIFAHGFTTKRDGHGFGLHHSANAAAEMGGRLGVESDGPGKGARFVLELPLRSSAAREEVEPVVAAAGAHA